MNKIFDRKSAADILTVTYFHSLMEWLWSKSDLSFSEDISRKIDMIFYGIGGMDLEREK